MKHHRFSLISKMRLSQVHADLQKVFIRGLELSPIDFSIIEGMRTVKRQAQLVESGASKTMNSRHLTGHAIDIAPYVAGKIRWDWPLFFQIEPAIKQAAKELNVDIEWGGDWKSFKDGPHWQLSWKSYPLK